MRATASSPWSMPRRRCAATRRRMRANCIPTRTIRASSGKCSRSTRTRSARFYGERNTLGAAASRLSAAQFALSLPQAVRFVQQAFANANRLRRDFHQFVVLDEFDCALQRQLFGRSRFHVLVGTRGAHIGELLLTNDVERDVFVIVGTAD